MLEASLRYRQPLRFDDEVDVHLVLASATRTTFQMAYLLTVDSTAAATGVTVHGLVTGAGRPVRLPDWLVALAPEPTRRDGSDRGATSRRAGTARLGRRTDPGSGSACRPVP